MRRRSSGRARVVWGVALIAVIALVVALAAGCGSSSSNSGTANTTQKADILRLAYTSTVTTWDPSVSFSTEVVYMANVYEPLMYANPPGAAEPFTPALATSWEVAKNGLSWTFHLRQGVTFHDGTPFNAQAVKYSIDRTKKLNLGAAYLWAPVKSVQVIDDYTVKMLLSYPVALDRIAAASSGSWIFSPATEGKSTKWWDKGHEDGTGPWILKTYKPNQELIFERNPHWWGTWSDNQYQKIDVQIVSEAGTQQQMLEAGQIDYAGLVDRDQLSQLQSNSSLDVVKAQSWNNYLMFFNTQHKPLDNMKVRQALSYAIPYQDLITVGTNGLATQAKGAVPVGLWPNAQGNVNQYTTDLDKAKQLLSDAGYPNGGFTLKLTYTAENPIEGAFVPLIKESFAKVGVTVQIQKLLWNQQWAKAKGPAAQRQDLFCLLWWPSLPDGYDNLNSMFRPEQTPAWNLSYWYDSDFDKLLTDAYKASSFPSTLDQSQQKYNEAQNMLVDQAVAGFLFDAQTVVAHLKTIKLDDMAINPNYPQVLFWTHVTL
ncbi:MAG TPA: ABC transporter substrate-binding protein [Thermoleophilia bacterium]|nr:ABC transporter substrate-binding protein [Thermoleophilia bacterium]